MSDSEDSDFSDNQSERSSDGEAEEVEENEVSILLPMANNLVARQNIPEAGCCCLLTAVVCVFKTADPKHYLLRIET